MKMRKKYIKPSLRVIPLGLADDVLYTQEGTLVHSHMTGNVESWGVKGEKGVDSGEGTYKFRNLWDEEW